MSALAAVRAAVLQKRRPGCANCESFLVLFLCSICVLDFPHCVVHEMPELTAESLVSQNNVSVTSG